MTRKEFIKMCALLGIGLPLPTALNSCNGDDETTTPNTNQKVIIIGAGAAGLTAGYLLKQQGIDFEILEASANYGGRMKRNVDFADFPIPLGAEWLHIEPAVFAEIVNDSSVQVDINTVPYNPNEDFGLFQGQQLTIEEVGVSTDRKFVNSTWFDFFEEYIVPAVQSQIQFNTVVTAVDYSGEQVEVKTANTNFSGNKVIVTVPLKILQSGTISFSPALPSNKQEAIDQTRVWDGCKAFIEFSEKFYSTFTVFETVPETAGERLYYDAAYGQNTAQHILGLFAIGVEAASFIQLSDRELIDRMLRELDEIYNGQASATYIKHTFQNWNAEPHINGAYLYDHEEWRLVRTLGESVGDKLYFAGEAYTEGEDWGGVHDAAKSAKRAVDALVG